MCAKLLSHVWPFAPSGLTPASVLCPWDSPGKNTGMGCHSSSRGSSRPRDRTCISCVSVSAGGFFTTSATGEAPNPSQAVLKKTKGQVTGKIPDTLCLCGELRSRCLGRKLWGASSAVVTHSLNWSVTPVRPAPRVPLCPPAADGVSNVRVQPSSFSHPAPMQT